MPWGVQTGPTSLILSGTPVVLRATDTFGTSSMMLVPVTVAENQNTWGNMDALVMMNVGSGCSA